MDKIIWDARVARKQRQIGICVHCGEPITVYQAEEDMIGTIEDKGYACPGFGSAYDPGDGEAIYCTRLPEGMIHYACLDPILKGLPRIG